MRYTLSAPITICKSLDIATKHLASCSSESPRLDAELLLGFTLKKPRTWLIAHADENLSPEDALTFKELVARRALGVPIAYLTGEREFWGRSFIVTPDVLIPRPETEQLVELALESLKTWIAALTKISNEATQERRSLRILDLGTGSGCLAVTLALELANALKQAKLNDVSLEVIAVDKSNDALRIAKSNAQRLGVDPNLIKFYQGDWFSALSGSNGEHDTNLASQKFDLIVSNPPYIAREDAPTLAKDLTYEPDMALFAEETGLRDLFSILRAAKDYLKDGASLLCEIGAEQRRGIESFVASEGLRYQQVKFFKDLAGHDRIVSTLN